MRAGDQKLRYDLEWPIDSIFSGMENILSMVRRCELVKISGMTDISCMGYRLN